MNNARISGNPKGDGGVEWVWIGEASGMVGLSINLVNSDEGKQIIKKFNLVEVGRDAKFDAAYFKRKEYVKK